MKEDIEKLKNEIAEFCKKYNCMIKAETSKVSLGRNLNNEWKEEIATSITVLRYY